MWQLYVFSFLAGLFGANGVPHFVKGIIGEEHQTPFGQPSSALVNVVWGWANFVVAMLFLYWAHTYTHRLRAFGLVAIGGLLMSVMLAFWWSEHPENNK